MTIEIFDLAKLEKGLNGVSNKATDDMINAKQVWDKLSAINGELKILNAKMGNNDII